MSPPLAVRLMPRAALPPLLGPAADFLVFNAALAAGLSLAAAHLAAFAAALAVSYAVQLRPVWGVRDEGITRRPLIWMLTSALAAVLLRGGILGLFATRLGWPAALAILPAILAGQLVMSTARELLLSPVPITRIKLLQRLAVAVVSYCLVLRLVYAPQIELLPEEAYYWNYAQHPALGYLDHPPMVAWLIKLGTTLFGNTELGVRLGSLLTQAVASFFVYRMARECYGRAAALVAVSLAQVLPFFFLAGLDATPDAPLTAAWAGCLYFLQRALWTGRPKAWLGVGVCLGLGLISKYTIGLLVPSALLFVLLDRESRQWLWRWQPYAACALAALLFSPVLVWNAQHEWASFAFQTSRRLADPADFNLHRLILSILVLITPAGLASLPVLLGGRGTAAMPHTGDMTRDETRGARRMQLFVQVFVGVPLSVFTLFSLRHEVKLDWTGETWLALLPALGAWLAAAPGQLKGRSPRLAAAWAPTAAVFLLLFAGLLNHLAIGLPGVGYSEHLELVPVGWRELGTQVNTLAAQLPQEESGPPLVVGMERYMLASELAFYGPDQRLSVANSTSAYLFGGLGVMYERWFPAETQRGRTLLLVAWKPEELAVERLAPRVTSLDPLHALDVVRNGRLIRHVYYRVAHGYRPAVGPHALVNTAGTGSAARR